MDDVEIQVIRAETLQTALDLSLDGFLREPAFVEVDLRGQHDLIPGNPVALQGPAQIFLRRPAAVAVCRVKEIDAKGQRVADHLLARRFIERPRMHRRLAKTHAAQAYARNLNIRLA